MSQYLKRLSFLVSILKASELTSDHLLELLKHQNFLVSQRQLQRDLKALQDILSPNESLKSYFLEGKKHFYIKSSTKAYLKSEGFGRIHATHTWFYHQTLDSKSLQMLEAIETAIHQKNTLEIQLVRDDETGDNKDLETSHCIICPVKILFHRASYYLACYNLKTKTIEFFGIRQLVKIQLGKPFKNHEKFSHFVEIELQKRFGISKNINDSVYDIEVEFTSATGRFIKDRHWHPSQKVTKKNGNYTLTMRCGINRELMGWLFQWMYNVKVIEPPILKNFYERTLKECKDIHKRETPFVYRNIFNN